MTEAFLSPRDLFQGVPIEVDHFDSGSIRIDSTDKIWIAIGLAAMKYEPGELDDREDMAAVREVCPSWRAKKHFAPAVLRIDRVLGARAINPMPADSRSCAYHGPFEESVIPTFAFVLDRLITTPLDEGGFVVDFVCCELMLLREKTGTERGVEAPWVPIQIVSLPGSDLMICISPAIIEACGRLTFEGASVKTWESANRLGTMMARGKGIDWPDKKVLFSIPETSRGSVVSGSIPIDSVDRWSDPSEWLKDLFERG